MNEHEDLGPLFVKAFHQFIDPPVLTIEKHFRDHHLDVEVFIKNLLEEDARWQRMRAMVFGAYLYDGVHPSEQRPRFDSRVVTRPCGPLNGL